MAEKRRDNRGRLLRKGESQRKNGRYVYQYRDSLGVRRSLYSWRLLTSDRISRGKQDETCLRDLEKTVQSDISGKRNPGITIKNMMDQYLVLAESAVAKSTFNNYKTMYNHVVRFGWANTNVKTVTISKAKMMIQSAMNSGLSVNVAKNLKSFLCNCFQLAYEDDVITKNPFCFKFMVKNQIGRRTALTVEEQDELLTFLQTEPELYRKYYNKVLFLLNTGLRVSEFCGLTLDDIDLENNLVHVNKQLQYNSTYGVYIAPPKSLSGNRVVPLNKEAASAVRWLIANRDKRGLDCVVDGYRNFLLLTNHGNPATMNNLQTQLLAMSKRFEAATGKPIKVTPHVLRHTFASNCVRRGINLKTLQIVMGHANYDITMSTYTHQTEREIVSKFLSIF